MDKIETPTLDRMVEIQEQSQLCGEFLDWFLRKYTVFDRKQKRESPFADVMGNGDYINKEAAGWIFWYWFSRSRKRTTGYSG